jgi:protein gp37
MAASRIEWTQVTWNPVSGCTRVSAGCDNCYAVGQTYRCENMGQEKYAGLTVLDKRGRRRFNGVVRCHESTLGIPLKWKKGRMIFVNSMSDLFHKGVPPAFIGQVFDVIRRCPQHVFQVLTKRPERVAELDADLDWPDNLWMGVSVEDSSVAHRIDLLRDECSAKMKWLSIEPLLGPIPGLCLLDIDWVVVGGESGPHGRPMQRDWIDDIHNLCVCLGIPFFFKQWGRLRNNPDPNDPTAKENGGTTKGGRQIDGHVRQEFPEPDVVPKKRRERRDG